MVSNIFPKQDVLSDYYQFACAVNNISGFEDTTIALQMNTKVDIFCSSTNDKISRDMPPTSTKYYDADFGSWIKYSWPKALRSIIEKKMNP